MALISSQIARVRGINSPHVKVQLAIEQQKHRFYLINSRSLSKIETVGLKKISTRCQYSLVSIINFYIDYSRNNVAPLLFLPKDIMEGFFLLWNYGKPGATQLLKEKVISESGMDDVYELAYQMQYHIYGTVNKNALKLRRGR